MKNASVLRAFRIIEYLVDCDDWVGARTLARDLDLDPSTVLRFLASLKELGYVRQHPDNLRYQLTLKFAWLSAKLLDKIQLRAVALPILEGLQTTTNETIHLGVLEGNQVVYVAKLDSHQPVQMRSRIGSRGYLHSTALGRAILAYLSPSEIETLLARLERPALTRSTITDIAGLREELKRVRERGYVIDEEENEVGIRCVGAPVFDHLGHVAGAVSVSGWTITMIPERTSALSVDVIKTCAAISHEMGYWDPSASAGDKSLISRVEHDGENPKGGKTAKNNE